LGQLKNRQVCIFVKNEQQNNVSMNMKSKIKPDELDSAGLRRVLRGTSARIVAENLQRGISMTVVEDGQLVEILPDETKRKLGRAVPRPTRISKTEFDFG
jgi:hypothetical protein